METEFEQIKFFAHCEICKSSFGGASQDEAQTRVVAHWTEKHDGPCAHCGEEPANGPSCDTYWDPDADMICESCADRAAERAAERACE